MSACSLLSPHGCNTDNSNNRKHLRISYGLLGCVLGALLHNIISSLPWPLVVGTVVLIFQSDQPAIPLCPGLSQG